MAKRGNGEGSICKRKDGTWQAQYVIGKDVTGKIKRKTVYGKTRPEVQKKLLVALTSIQNNSYIEPTKVTFGEWLENWLEIYMKEKLKITTYDSYKMQIEAHIKPSLGHIILSKLQTFQLQSFLREKLTSGRKDKKEGGLSAKSVRYLHTIIHSCLEQAVKEQLIPINPAGSVVLPRLNKKEIQIFSDEDLKNFLNTAKTVNMDKEKDNGFNRILHYTAYNLALSTGMRRGEILGLRWKNINCDKKFLSINEQIVRSNEKGLIFTEPKTHLSRRSVPLSTRTIELLKNYRKIQLETKLKAGKLYQKHDLVFCNEIGQPKDPRSFSRYYEKVLKKSKIISMGFHSLRHTFVVKCIQNKIDINTISKILGHHSVSFTLDVYGHVIESMKTDCVEVIDEFLKMCENKNDSLAQESNNLKTNSTGSCKLPAEKTVAVKLL